MRHRLSRADILAYALEGALTRRGVMSGNLTDKEEDLLDKDIKEIELRIKGLPQYAVMQDVPTVGVPARVRLANLKD